MKNLLLDGRTAQDIDGRVQRIHRDLDYRGGRIELAEVRALLQLDLAHYAVDEPGLLGEVVHRLKVGAKQVINRPGLLLDAVRKFDLRALFVPDRKQILIDSTLPDRKKRWAEGHEIIHSVVPWHADYMLGDTKATLTPSCHDRIEAEANYGAGRLFFPPGEFLSLRSAQPIDMARIQALAKHFGNSNTSTLWRCIESDERPCFGLVSAHPHQRSAATEVEYLIQSPQFAARFSNFSETTAMRHLRTYCRRRRGGPLGSAEIVLVDDNGDDHLFVAETFCFHHQTLTLAQYIRPRPLQVVVPETALSGRW